MDVKLWEQQISNKENVTNQTKGEKIKFAFFCARLNFYIAKLRFRFSLIFDLCTISNDIFRWYYRVWMCKRRQQKRKGKRDSENKCKKQHIEQIYWIISDLTDLNDIEWIVWLFTSFEKKNFNWSICRNWVWVEPKNRILTANNKFVSFDSRNA